MKKLKYIYDENINKIQLYFTHYYQFSDHRTKALNKKLKKKKCKKSSGLKQIQFNKDECNNKTNEKHLKKRKPFTNTL